MLDELSVDSEALQATEGVIVTDVATNTPAADFGLQKGDVIVDVNGAAIHDTNALVDATAQHARSWDLTIARNGQTIRTRISF